MSVIKRGNFYLSKSVLFYQTYQTFRNQIQKIFITNEVIGSQKYAKLRVSKNFSHFFYSFNTFPNLVLFSIVLNVSCKKKLLDVKLLCTQYVIKKLLKKYTSVCKNKKKAFRETVNKHLISNNFCKEKGESKSNQFSLGVPTLKKMSSDCAG